jgi:hypothetical protein
VKSPEMAGSIPGGRMPVPDSLLRSAQNSVRVSLLLQRDSASNPSAMKYSIQILFGP